MISVLKKGKTRYQSQETIDTEEDIFANNKISEEDIYANNKISGEDIFANNKISEEDIYANNKISEEDIFENNKISEEDIYANNKISTSNDSSGTILMCVKSENTNITDSPILVKVEVDDAVTHGKRSWDNPSIYHTWFSPQRSINSLDLLRTNLRELSEYLY